MTQNSHSCCSAQPPWKIATAVLRAGLTEVLVTGMLIKWMRVSARPMAMGAKPAAHVYRSRMNNQEEAAGQDNFNDDSRQHGEAARGVFAIAVGGEATGGGIKAGFTAGNHVQHRRGNNSADHLSDNIANDLFCRKTAAGPQA